MGNTIIITIEENRNGINNRYIFHLKGNVWNKGRYESIEDTVEAYRSTGTLFEHMNKLADKLGEKYPTTAVFFTTE